MEIRTENTEDITKFFLFFNEIMEKHTGKIGIKFNPRCIVCDESGANYAAIRAVYGEDFCNNCVKGCQWHFKNDVNKKANDVNPEYRDLFKSTCMKLCHVTTVAKYTVLKSKLDEIVKMSPRITKWIDCGMREGAISLGHSGTLDYLELTWQNKAIHHGKERNPSD